MNTPLKFIPLSALAGRDIEVRRFFSEGGTDVMTLTLGIDKATGDVYALSAEPKPAPNTTAARRRAYQTDNGVSGNHIEGP